MNGDVRRRLGRGDRLPIAPGGGRRVKFPLHDRQFWVVIALAALTIDSRPIL